MLRWNWNEMPSCYSSKGFPPPTTSRHESDESSELWVTQKKMSNFSSSWNLKENREVTIQAVFMMGWKDRGKAACDDNSCTTWQSKRTLKVTLLSLIDSSALTDRKGAPRSCPVQADRPRHRQEELTPFCFTKGDAGGQSNGLRHCSKAVSAKDWNHSV